MSGKVRILTAATRAHKIRVNAQQGLAVKKETIVTAIVFLSVGFLAGYIYNAQKSSALRQKAVTSAPMNGSDGDSNGAGSVLGAASDGTSLALPEGHPPVNDTTLVRFFEEEAARNPKDSRPCLKLANLYFDRRDFQDAAAWYEKTLTLDPENVDARTDLGTAYFNLNRPRDAVREFQRSLKIDPHHQAALFNLSVVNLEGIHDPAAARQAYERLEKINPSYPGLDRLRQRIAAAGASPNSP